MTRVPPSFIVSRGSSQPGRSWPDLYLAAIGLRPGPSDESNIRPLLRYALYLILTRSPACGVQPVVTATGLNTLQDPSSRSKYFTPPSVSKNLRAGAAALAGCSAPSSTADTA